MAVALGAPAATAPGDLELVSRGPGAGGAPADAQSIFSSISADGTRIAFDSDADNLSAEDDDVHTNVFVRDLRTGETILASRASGPAGPAADDSSVEPSISADGRYVVFRSGADNLSSEDDDAVTNIFVRDLVAGTTILVSRASGAGGAPANGDSFEPDISADGRYVAFRSSADNLSSEDDDSVENLYVRDLVAQTTTLVSRATGPVGAGADGNSFAPAISGDGRRVAFDSAATNLSADDGDAVRDVFVRDLATARTMLVSRASGPAGPAGDGDSTVPDISRSGRFIAFASLADNLSAEDDDTVLNVFLRDLAAGTTSLVSRADGAAGAGADGSALGGSPPSVADNGRVAFDSDADNLSSEDSDAVFNVFVRDALAGTTTLVSRGPGPGGAAADQGSFLPAITPDGRYVAFQSLATNLVAGSAPGVRNIYRRDVLGEPALSAAPACKALPPAPAPRRRTARIALTSRQLLINQRIGQAAIRRLNAVEARLNAGLQARDLCGHAVGPDRLGEGITTVPATVSLAPAAPADPAPITDPGRRGRGGTVSLTARQLLINQRIYQAALRRARAIDDRLDRGLTGGDIRDGAVTQGKLIDRLFVSSAPPTAQPAPSTTVIPPRRGRGRAGAVRLSAAQLRINQRIAQAGVRQANTLIRRLETGISGEDLRPGTLTAADLG